ncbi:MAG: ABC transporter ATP-binding protein [Myxococcota bacterium]|nr:ABC transporter ATP-binding protein [Myxococcota bacterium]
MSNLVTVKGLSRSFPSGETTIQAVQKVQFNVAQGEFVAIVGASGSGKSTLLSLLAGLDVPNDGGVWLLEQAIHEMNEEERARFRRKHLGFIFQSFQLFAEYTALENVLFPLELQGELSYEAATQKATAILTRLGLGSRLDHKPAKLSGGEQQRVAIARAFVAEPPILFADEPTGNLDQDTGRVVEEVLFELQRETKTTVILVTHDLELAEKADRVLVMSGGRLSERL